MLARPINNIVKDKFLELFNKANDLAQNDFVDNIESKLKGLDHFNQTKLVIDELARIEERVNKNDYPYYIENHSSEEWLLNQFASRAFLLEADDSLPVVECIRLGKYRSLVSEIKFSLKDSVPLYTYADFISGKIDQYFSNFDYFYNVSEEDYYKIREWQADKLIQIVSYESRLLITNIQSYCNTLSDPLSFINSEKTKTEAILKNQHTDAKLLKSMLSELFIFQGMEIHFFDDNLLIENSKIYGSEQINWRHIVPDKINPLIEKVIRNSSVLISNEATLFFTLNKIDFWLELIIKGQNIQQPVTETKWDKLFNEIINNAKSQADSLVKGIEQKVHKRGISKDSIKSYLINEFDSYRHKFNSFEKKYYFAILDKEKDNVLKSMFITNSFFGNDIKEQSDSIAEAIIIQNVSWEVLGIYDSFFNGRDLYDNKKESSHIEIMFLMHQMVLDKELHLELNKSMFDFFKHFHSCFLPMEFYLQNHRELFADLFQKSLHRLQPVLDNAEPSKKVLYLQSRLKQLKQRELEHKNLISVELFDKNELRYTTLFKDFLEIEADFIRETKDIQFTPVSPDNINLAPINLHSLIAPSGSHSVHTPKLKKAIPVAFTYRSYNTNQSAITDLHNNLIKNQFIDSDTSLANFRKIFTNIEPTIPIVWLRNITELAYFVKLIHLKYKYIEPLGNDVWKVTANIFVGLNNVPFHWKCFRGQKKPARSKMLESAASLLK